MIMRIFGGLLVCLSCTLIGVYLGAKGARRLRLLTELKKSFFMLKSEIEYSIYPLPQAFNNLSARLDPLFADFYTDVSGRISGGEHLDAAWAAACKELAPSQLAREDINEIAGLGKALGSIDKDVQLNAIDMVISAISDTSARLGAENVKKGRMYRSLGILTGLLVVIILL